MRDKEGLKKLVDALKKDVTDKLSKAKDPEKDPNLRRLRKNLRRAQRKLRLLEGKKRRKKEGQAAPAAPPGAPPQKPAGS